MQRIGIIGAGAWGTALALVARRAGRDVVIWSYEPEVAEAINTTHENSAFLAGIPLDPGIRATTDPGVATDADAVLVVTPAQRLRDVCEATAPSWRSGVPAVICAKGIEQKTGALMTEVAAAALPPTPLAVLSGPTFAGEVAHDLPTAVTLACHDEALGDSLSAALRNPHFRIYCSTDVIGAQIGGAVKNVLAIACGIVEGRRFGDNARAALVTRGLAEIARLGAAKGARAETLMGLCGIGDLTLTCSAPQSRNYSLGIALGQGKELTVILGARQSVAEGVYTAASVNELAARSGVELPICAAVDSILNRGADIDVAIAGLLARPFGAEMPAAKSSNS